MCDFTKNKKNTPSKPKVDKVEKLQQQKIDAAKKFNPPPPKMCLAVKK